MSNDIMNKAKAWANNPSFDFQDRQEIQDLIDRHDIKELTERFYKDLEFGTGGMRSILGMGLNRINKYTVRKATAAMALVVLEQKHPSPCVVVSYDSRRFSFEFSLEVAGVLAAYGIKAKVFRRLNPVSFLSFAVRHFKAQAGVMITASHNPKEYNGYKAFWSDGAQVTPPFDEAIIKTYGQITDFSQIKYINPTQAQNEGLLEWIDEDFEDMFIHLLKQQAINPKLCQQYGEKIKMVYTPIHGAGLYPVTKILNAYGLTNYTVIKEQSQPDGTFPTVDSPNPENPSALKMAVDKMFEIKADIAMGTDPDADRIGVCINHQNHPYYLNGNQLGILMLDYTFSELLKQNRMPSSPYFVQSIVTSPLQQIIAKHYGVTFERTLTGFKWICGKVSELEVSDPNRTFLFGTEESFGYLNHPYVRDKDATGPMGLLAEMALFHKLQGKTLVDALDDIYERFGFSQEDLLNLVYEGKEGGEKIDRIMKNFRNYHSKEMCGEKIEWIEDYLDLQESNIITGQKQEIKMPQSNVLGYRFESGNILYLRPSGTEPKIKFYIMIQERQGSLQEKKSNAQKKIDLFIHFLKEQSDKA